MDKAAGREENVPTGGAVEENISKEWNKYLPEETWEKASRSTETEQNPSGRHEGIQSGRQLYPSGLLEENLNGKSTLSSNVQASKPTSTSVFNKDGGIPLGRNFGQLSLDPDYEKQDYNKRKMKSSNVTFERNEEIGSSSKPPCDVVSRRCHLSMPPLNVTIHQEPLPFPEARSSKERGIAEEEQQISKGVH